VAKGRAKAGRRGKRARNPAIAKGVNKSEVKSMINDQLFQFEFNADYNQIMLRVDEAPHGLRNGGPPPKVS